MGQLCEPLRRKAGGHQPGRFQMEQRALIFTQLNFMDRFHSEVIHLVVVRNHTGRQLLELSALGKERLSSSWLSWRSCGELGKGRILDSDCLWNSSSRPVNASAHNGESTGYLQTSPVPRAQARAQLTVGVRTRSGVCRK